MKLFVFVFLCTICITLNYHLAFARTSPVTSSPYDRFTSREEAEGFCVDVRPHLPRRFVCVESRESYFTRFQAMLRCISESSEGFYCV